LKKNKITKKKEKNIYIMNKFVYVFFFKIFTINKNIYDAT